MMRVILNVVPKFRRRLVVMLNEWEAFIEGEWYDLCACRNCLNVAALSRDSPMILLDKGVACCDKPDYIFRDVRSEDDIIYKAVEEFVKSWQ